jgi:hypothetical protein
MGEPIQNYRELYDSLGLKYFPLKQGTKIPAVSQGFKSPEKEIEAALKSMRDYNIALVCGVNSKNLIVFDFESEPDAWAFFQDKEKLLKSTLVIRSPHKVVHVYFQTSDKCPIRRTKLCAPDHSFDLCGEGGYVVAPPSIIDHSLCDPKSSKCNHRGKSAYEIISSAKEILLISKVEAVLTKRCFALGWQIERASKRILLGSYQEIFDKALSQDLELKELFEGKKIPKSRSESEFALIIRLVKFGFPDEAIYEILGMSQIGKWQESSESYKSLTLTKARKYVIRSRIEARVKCDSVKGDRILNREDLAKRILGPNKDSQEARRAV